MGAMTNNKKMHKSFAWLAIFAILLASLAPSISRAVYGQTIPASGWLELCTANGLQHLPVALFEGEQSPVSHTPKSPDPYSGGHFEHCPFCVTQAFSFGLTPVEAVSLPLMALQGHDVPSHELPAPHARFIWQHNRARAPPFFL